MLSLGTSAAQLHVSTKSVWTTFVIARTNKLLEDWQDASKCESSAAETPAAACFIWAGSGCSLSAVNGLSPAVLRTGDLQKQGPQANKHPHSGAADAGVWRPAREAKSWPPGSPTLEVAEPAQGPVPPPRGPNAMTPPGPGQLSIASYTMSQSLQFRF